MVPKNAIYKLDGLIFEKMSLTPFAAASELIRHMLTVSSSERATIEDICSHWWVNEGYAECCLLEAESLASQTPVRLDLLLSLAPKQISSEHMLIQPEEDDISQKVSASLSSDPANLTSTFSMFDARQFLFAVAE